MSGAISWTSRHQTIVAQSTDEAEYVEACEEAMEANPTFGRRTRHIELKWHYVREQVRKKELYTRKVRSQDNLAYLFTKPLAKSRFESLSAKIGMCTRKAGI
ncbi:hypothetical protein PC116_g4045 [Phytophthora cactorum]|uniref:Uncharacterized protein n=1 Tax=Phytophthora cactorum TaxID=29920 RepID=A0A8T1DUK5_9STRA|nr:hypothetical protein PC112_g1881 [Phytophthora cactorum]KAG2846461.1 hypothetical protein PC111_g1159 [Phytophthora cactorum]KAG2867577.1 hypothetical protein PC113_g1831 [Phytophthora cactorum]KAG2931365.1 hypothetical protein PC114_g2212 [Phytophthora cactorum]KAG2942602.1 hypothetical protein PC115_g1317 [Phytophthora cactorum]